MTSSVRRTQFFAAAFAMAFTLLAAAPARAHSLLTHSEPSESAVLRTPPATLVLQFAEPIRVMTVRLVDAAGNETALTRAGERTDATQEVRAAVNGRLAAGDYRIDWRGASDDGHVGGGTVRFKVEATR